MNENNTTYTLIQSLMLFLGNALHIYLDEKNKEETSGLCGNYDDEILNDMKMRDGSITGNPQCKDIQNFIRLF